MEKKHKISKAQQKAVNRYIQKNYDRMYVFLSKGKKNEIRAHAEAQGESLNAFIFRAITETMEREHNQDTTKKQNTEEHKTQINTSNPTTPPSTPAKVLKTEENNSEVIPQDLQSLLLDNEELVDLDRLLSDMMYQFDVQNTFGADALAYLLDKARNKNT